MKAAAFDESMDETGYLYMDRNGRVAHNSISSFNFYMLPHGRTCNRPTLKVVVRDLHRPHRTLIFVGIRSEQERNVSDWQTGERQQRHMLAIYVVQSMPKNECTVKETKNSTVFNCYQIHPCHWRLLTRIHNESNMQRIPVALNQVPEGLHMLMESEWVKVATRTHNKVAIDNSNLSEVLRVVQDNVHPEEDSSRAVATVASETSTSTFTQKKLQARAPRQ